MIIIALILFPGGYGAAKGIESRPPPASSLPRLTSQLGKARQLMGNCQASDAVAAVVELPCGGVDKIYWRVTARQLMLQNPGHYVGVYVWPKPSSSARRQGIQGKPKLKLLPPAALLNAGKCYRLVTYEEVIGDLSQGRGNIKIPKDAIAAPASKLKVSPDMATAPVANRPDEAKPALRPGQWRPSLQSISELGAQVR